MLICNKKEVLCIEQQKMLARTLTTLLWQPRTPRVPRVLRNPLLLSQFKFKLNIYNITCIISRYLWLFSCKSLIGNFLQTSDYLCSRIIYLIGTEVLINTNCN